MRKALIDISWFKCYELVLHTEKFLLTYLARLSKDSRSCFLRQNTRKLRNLLLNLHMDSSVLPRLLLNSRYISI